jgi:excisionase family DNA binding protein
MPEYLSIKDVAEHLNVEYKTVYRLVRQGEIPAAKVGGVYRIHRDDVSAYIQQQTRKVAPSSSTETPTSEVVKCGICLRLLRTERDIAGQCAFDDCDAPICAACWQEGRRYCVTHRPSRTEQLKRAQQEFRQGEVPVLVTSMAARQREKNYIARFETKVQRITKVWHPLRGQVISPPKSWDQLHHVTDGADALMKLLHTGFLEEDVEQGMPLNVASRYHVPDQGQGSPGLVLEARLFAHMQAFVEQGFDTQPATVADLDHLLDAVVADAEALQVVHLVGLASPTGWTEAAQAYVATGEPGSTFHHRLVLPCLVDLAAFQVYHNAADDRLTPLVSLFAPRLSQEEVGRAVDYVKRALVISSGVSVQEVCAETGVEEPLVRQAFAKLVAAGSHRAEAVEGIGQVIVRADG